MLRRPCVCVLCFSLLAAPELSGARLDAGPDCAASLDTLSSLRADLAQDSALADLAASLANSTTPPAGAQVEQLQNEGLRALTEAGDAIESHAERTAEAMRQARLATTAGKLSRALNDLRQARSTYHQRLWPERSGGRGSRGTVTPPANATFSVPIGVGTRVTYEAVESYEQAVESFGLIRAETAAQAEAGYHVVPIEPDLPLPPNPSMNPVWEGIRALRATEARAKMGALGYRTAAALRAQPGTGARQLAARMRDPLRDANAAVQELERLAAPCATPAQKPQAKKAGPNKPVGKIVAIGMIAAGGGVLAASQAIKKSGADGGGSTNAQPSIVSFSEWICSGTSCAGTLTIDFPVVMSSGVITVGTPSLFLGQANVSPTSPPGRVTFQMIKSPYLTCYGTQTGVAIWNGPTINTGPATYKLPASIPVTCR